MKNSHILIVFIMAILAFGVTVPRSASAIDFVDVLLSPEDPGEYEDVTLSLRSYTTDITSSMISWFIDGSAVDEGIGMTEFQTRTRGLGEPVKVSVIIVTPSGSRIDRDIILTPAEVDLLWEADTTVPPFYRGKALPTARGTVRVAAFPRFGKKESDPSEYFYEWYYDYTKKVGEGLARSSALIPTAKEGVRTNVTVKVRTQDRSAAATGMLMFPTVAPKVVMYERDPLMGVTLDRPIGKEGIATTKDSIILRSYPLYFSQKDLNAGKLKIQWFVNDVLLPNETTNELVIQNNGVVAATVRYDNFANILQQAFQRVPISFIERR